MSFNTVQSFDVSPLFFGHKRIDRPSIAQEPRVRFSFENFLLVTKISQLSSNLSPAMQRLANQRVLLEIILCLIFPSENSDNENTREISFEFLLGRRVNLKIWPFSTGKICLPANKQLPLYPTMLSGFLGEDESQKQLEKQLRIKAPSSLFA